MWTLKCNSTKTQPHASAFTPSPPNRGKANTMRIQILYKKVSYSLELDRINAYHAALFHGRLRNQIIKDKHWGDALDPLVIEKNVFDCKYVFQPQRNLVIPTAAMEKLTGFPHVGFQKVVFSKLFYCAYHKGSDEFGPRSCDQLGEWLDEFKHDPQLAATIEPFYELLIPNYRQVFSVDEHTQEYTFRSVMRNWLQSTLKLSPHLLSEYPMMWSNEGILVRSDIATLLHEHFDWDYFAVNAIDT
jgi:hypothetical protein